MRSRRADLYVRVRVHFVGTGKTPSDALGHNVLPMAGRIGVDGVVTEHPHRMPYADVLTHLHYCSAPLVIGSTEPHYTPSKIFQAVQSKHPVFALLHDASTARDVLRQSGAGTAMTLNETRLPTPEAVADELIRFIESAPQFDARDIDWAAFEAYSARHSARLMAAALDAGLDKYNRRNGSK